MNNNLMKGDYFNYNGTIVRVFSYGVNVVVKDVDGKNKYVVKENDLQPIPISSEFMKNNGFAKELDYTASIEEYDSKKLDFPFTIAHDIIHDEWYGGTYMVGRDYDWIEKQFSCQYIHQLQHAFNLCNITKEFIIN